MPPTRRLLPLVLDSLCVKKLVEENAKQSRLLLGNFDKDGGMVRRCDGVIRNRFWRKLIFLEAGTRTAEWESWQD
jgi:hypothetical protein